MIYLVGIGMGDGGTITEKAKQIIEECDLVIGARRMTEGVVGKKVFNVYKPEDVKNCLDENIYKNAAVLLSGDVGFFSAAEGIIQVLGNKDFQLVAGISSVAYFCARLGICWQDAKLLSKHGRECNLIGHIMRNKRVIALLSNAGDVKILCEKLCFYGMGDVVLNIGERLSYADERITTVRADEIVDFNFDQLLCVVIENKNPQDLSLTGIDDACFVRGNVPMTKSEVRTLSLSKLGLNQNSVLYDIGAGTGSISVEAAIRLVDGKVFAIEKRADAIELIQQNKQKFSVDNLKIVQGEAPQAIENLPVPTHAFIGGSSGNMLEIINCLYQKNKNVKIVINAISLNTIAEVTGIINQKGIDAEIISVNIAKNKNVADYQLMQGQNPVYIITFK